MHPNLLPVVAAQLVQQNQFIRSQAARLVARLLLLGPDSALPTVRSFC